MRILNAGIIVTMLCVLLNRWASGAPPGEGESDAATQFLIRINTGDNGVVRRAGRETTDEEGQVVGLNLTACPLQPGDAQIISQFKQLRSLILSRTSISDDDVAAVSQLPKLGRLDLSDTRISNAALVHVSQLKLLTELSLSSTSISNNAIPELARLPLLQHLNLSRTKLTDASAETLATLNGLVSIKLSETPIGDPVLESLGQLPLLRTATFGGTKVTEAGLARFAELERFQWMETDETVVREFAQRMEAGDTIAVENMLGFGLRMPSEGTFRIKAVEKQPATSKDESLKVSRWQVDKVSRWRVEWDWKAKQEDIGLFVQILIQQRTVTVTEAGILE